MHDKMGIDKIIIFEHFKGHKTRLLRRSRQSWAFQGVYKVIYKLWPTALVNLTAIREIWSQVSAYWI